MLRRFSLPVRLALLVGGTMLPLILFSAVITYTNYQQDRREAFDRVLQVTRGIRLVMDREMQGIVSSLRVLANSRAIANGDLDAFRLNAEAFVQQFPGNSAVVLSDANGQQIFNSRIPRGQPLPMISRPRDNTVFKTGKPVFSPLFIGAVLKQPIVTVSVPVFRDGAVVYELGFNPPLELFQRAVDQQTPDSDWTIAIFDQSGTNFARFPNPQQTVGQSASPTLRAVMFTAPEGRTRTLTLEGVGLITAFSRSELTGWIVAGGVSEQGLLGPALQAVVVAIGVGLIMLLVGLTFAVRMATQIARGEQLHTLLINELNHRVKNTLSTVQAMAAQTFRGAADAEARQKFSSRLVALGSAHNLLSESKWVGADIRDTLEAVLKPFESGTNRISLEGPWVSLDSRTVTILSMVIQELATNAAKYGALASPGGRVEITWQTFEMNGKPAATLRWREHDGPPVKEPLRTGFGSTLIREGFAAQLGGSARMQFNSDGLSCELEFPLR